MTQAVSQLHFPLSNQVKPSKLLESPGNVDFDPLQLSDQLDQHWAQTAELKHGRVAMLAVVGFILQQYIHLPAEQFSANNPFEAVARVPLAGHLQIFLCECSS